VRHLFESYQAAATAARTAVVPAAGFYFAISDWLVCLSGAEVDSPGRVTVAYAVEDWRMTRASRETAMALSGGERLVYFEGQLRAVRAGAEVSEFSFPPPLGQQQVLAYPGGEVLTVPRHTPVEDVRVVMTASTFNQATFTSDDISAAERAHSRFTVVVDIETPSATYTRTATGRDIYGLGALTAVEVSIDLVARAGNAPVGVLSPAEAVDARQLLERLPRALLVTEESMTAHHEGLP
jgi:short subunit dehydrogenase-like uncharacterized protein